ncbi:hypothetical protein AMTR_s00043p00167720 [Amborella trichopoda]|uniref:Uncharacterized protein n=1 Tax=Amborella trichopoda TaxID=13333 RepID=W1PXN3_AMBTC|nr:hypothetical protein AMTR_s00043p00167720 [Amborella trichopoda]
MGVSSRGARGWKWMKDGAARCRSRTSLQSWCSGMKTRKEGMGLQDDRAVGRGGCASQMKKREKEELSSKRLGPHVIVALYIEK